LTVVDVYSSALTANEHSSRRNSSAKLLIKKTQ